MVVDFRPPQLLAGRRADRIGACAGIAEIRRPAIPALTDDDRRSNALACIELPKGASTLSVERIDLSALASDKQAPANNGRLRDRSGRAGEAKRPLQFQAGQVGLCQPRHVRRLKAMLGRIDPPTVPMRYAQ